MGQLLHILRDDVARQRQRGERLMPAGLDQQGRRAVRRFGNRVDFADTVAVDHAGEETRPAPAEACTEVGQDTRPAALSMARHRRTAGRVALSLIAGPAVAAAVAIAGFAAQHWPG